MSNAPSRMTGDLKRAFAAVMAAGVLIGGFAGGAAVAKEHDNRGRGEPHHNEGRGPPSRGEWRGGPPPGYGGPPQGYRQSPPPGYAVPGPYGPPPGYEAYSPRGYGVRRGGYLPPDLRSGMVQDYGRYRLRPPPRGYAWVRVGGGYALVESGSGQIFDIVPY